MNKKRINSNGVTWMELLRSLSNEVPGDWTQRGGDASNNTQMEHHLAVGNFLHELRYLTGTKRFQRALEL